MVKKSGQMSRKLLCLICCTAAFAIVAGNDDQPEATTENSSRQNNSNATEVIGRLDGNTLIFDELTMVLTDSSVIPFNPDVTCITISQGVRSLNNEIFQWWENLHEVYLARNFLTAVPTQALSLMPSLEFLSIGYNLLGTLATGDEFVGLERLTTLYLQSNKINFLHPNTFASLRVLSKLNLSENQLTSLEGLILPSENQLDKLDLSYNFIKRPNESIFSRLSGLKELNLANNLIETLPDNTFSELHVLRRLDLSDNFLKTLSSKLFTSNTDLIELELSNNLIETLPVDVFVGLKHLWHLKLENNRLTSLPADIFQDQIPNANIALEGNHISGLEPCFLQTVEVNLHYNRFTRLSISSFDAHTYNITVIESLYLNGNEIATIDENVFERLPNLENILLNHNRIAELSPMLFHKNKQLMLVNLSYNRLSVLRTHTFYGLPKLEHVDLSYNELSIIEPGVFPHSPVRYIDLNGNQLKTLHDWTFAGTKLHSLYVDYNAIGSLESDGTILNELLLLSASNNQIASWQEFCTSNFTQLGYINLANNLIPSIEGGCLDHLHPRRNNSPDLDSIDVDVSYNALTAVPVLDGYIRSLDLSGNNVSDLGDGNAFRWYHGMEILKLLNTSLRMVRSESFTFLPGLTNLQISSNVLELIEEDAFHALKLQQLILSNSILQTLPSFLLKEQTSLYSVSLANNKLSHLSSTFFSDCHMLIDINLSQNKLATVDHRWFQGLENLKIVNLESNVITRLPPNLISAEHSLSTLMLAGNALRSIADAVFLTNSSITNLDLSNNNLEDIDILQHNNIITELDVSGNRLERLLIRPRYYNLKANANRITSLQWEAESYSDLLYLYLADNLLNHLDLQIFNIPMLTDLDVSGNRLDTFPFELVYMVNFLNNLNISRNNIHTLPLANTVERFKLKMLDLSENPLVNQPSTFLDSCVVDNVIGIVSN